MELKELMIHERRKAVIRALAELEIATSTFYGELEQFEKVDEVRKKLKEFKVDHLD